VNLSLCLVAESRISLITSGTVNTFDDNACLEFTKNNCKKNTQSFNNQAVKKSKG